MTEQEQKAKFQQAIDHTLSGLQGDSFLYQRVAARSGKGEKQMKYTVPRGFVMAIIVMLCMGTAAVAAGLYGGSINWAGEVIEDERIGTSQATVSPASAGNADANDVIMKAAETYERSGEMLVITRTAEDGSRVPDLSRRVICDIGSEAELQALLGQESPFPLPAFIPEGYVFERGEVFYECRAGGEYELVAQHDMPAGVKVHRYRIRSGDEFPQGYYLAYRASQEDYHWLAITVQLTGAQSLNDHRFGYLAGQTAQIVTVPGMDNALAITGDHTCHLTMRRVLPETVAYLVYYDLIPRQETYAEVEVSISAPLLDVDTLIRMFAAE